MASDAAASISARRIKPVFFRAIVFGITNAPVITESAIPGELNT
jgi:hypothetical protein